MMFSWADFARHISIVAPLGLVPHGFVNDLRAMFSSLKMCFYVETPHAACVKHDGGKTQQSVRPDMIFFFPALIPIKHDSGNVYSPPAFLRKIVNLM